MKASKIFLRATGITGFMVLILTAIALDAQVTKEDYIRAERFLPANARKLVFKTEVRPNWIGESDRFWYLNNTQEGKEFILVEPARSTRRLAFEHVKLAAALSKESGKAYVHNKLPFTSFEFVQDGRAIQFDVGKDRWTCNLKTYECTKTEKPKRKPIHELISPDESWAAFVKDYNIYVRPADKEEEIVLTSDGEEYYDYGSSPEGRTTTVTERLLKRKRPPVALWSPDSKKLVTHKLDQRKVGELHLVQSVPSKGSRPVLHSYRYSLPGDKELPLAELVILDVEKKTKIVVEADPLLAPFWSPIDLQYVWWSKDSDKVYFLWEERGCKVLKLFEADAQTGKTRMLIEESGKTYVEPHPLISSQPNVRILGSGSEIIWFSERDGWAHLYLYDGNKGTLKNQITKGAWAVHDIVHVDESTRWIYFLANGREKGRSPYFRHLYRAKLDGSNLELLTPEEGDHEVAFSKTNKYFVDTFSKVDAAPVSVLRSVNGRVIRKLEEADVELLLATGWKWPEPFCVKARDGITDIYGTIFRPSKFDPKKKYPVIDSIYPGPQIIQNFPIFSVDLPGNVLALAELGFIVITIDGMGTPLRSKLFHDVSYGKLGEAGGLEDHITGLRQLATRYPYMDLTRVGIYGHSGGGFASARAILAYPDFYKVAVSSAGSHDVRSYISLWGEKYQGLLKGKNYENQVNANLAKNLKGKLLLVYGDMDDNVHPAMTIQLINALIKENKDFDLVVLPNNNHSFSRYRMYFTRRRWDYFVKHLLGEEPPKGYKIGS
jgi:dipeptidyl-peptidase-4